MSTQGANLIAEERRADIYRLGVCGVIIAMGERVLEIRRTIRRAKETQDNNDYDSILQRDDDIRKSRAVCDILASQRLPFMVKEDRDDASSFAFPPISISSSKAKSAIQRIGSPSVTVASSSRSRLHARQKTRTSMSQSLVSMSSHAARTLEGKLQYVLELINKAKTDLDPSRLFFEAGVIFDELQVDERAAACLAKATRQSNAERIVDQIQLVNDVIYQRKVERMSPTVLPRFLAERAQLRSRLIFEESERQRLRARAANCELSRLYSLTSVRDLWKAHESLQASFLLCRSDIEHLELLKYFHALLCALSNDMNGQAEFKPSQQIMRASAGPMSDAHLQILQELELREPHIAEYQDWLGMRYTEKCMFEEAQHHYKTARDLRTVKPDKQTTLELWRKPVNQPTEASLAMQARIESNVSKHALLIYQNYEGDEETVRQQSLKKDLAWFSGKHNDMATIVYTPPPQGWTTQAK